MRWRSSTARPTWTEAQARTTARSTDQARSCAEGVGRGEFEGPVAVAVGIAVATWVGMGVAGVQIAGGVAVATGVIGSPAPAWGTGVQIGPAGGTANRSVGAAVDKSGGASCHAMPLCAPASCRDAGAGGSESIEKTGPGSRGFSAKQRRHLSASAGSGCEQRWQSM